MAWISRDLVLTRLYNRPVGSNARERFGTERLNSSIRTFIMYAEAMEIAGKTLHISRLIGLHVGDTEQMPSIRLSNSGRHEVTGRV